MVALIAKMMFHSRELPKMIVFIGAFFLGLSTVLVMAESTTSVADENSENLKPWLQRVSASRGLESVHSCSVVPAYFLIMNTFGVGPLHWYSGNHDILGFTCPT